MKIQDLVVTQNDLRNWNELPAMISFVKKGNFWTKDKITEFNKVNKISHSSSLICLVQFKEDDTIYIHDGHHRVYSTWYGGRSHLTEHEYYFLFKDFNTKERWSYKDYMEFNPNNNWYTPYDPKNEVRLANFFSFKEIIKQKLLTENSDSVEDWVRKNSDLYKVTRTVFSISGFCYY
jgi:hypothetical protein